MPTPVSSASFRHSFVAAKPLPRLACTKDSGFDFTGTDVGALGFPVSLLARSVSPSAVSHL